MEALTAEDRREGWKDRKRTEYRVCYCDEYGDIHDSDFYETIQEARHILWAWGEELIRDGHIGGENDRYYGLMLERVAWIVRTLKGDEVDAEPDYQPILECWAPGYPLED